MEMQAYPDTPQDLKDQIEGIVNRRTGGTIRDLHVHVIGNDVVVNGRTNTYYNKQLATHAVLDTLTDIKLSNEIDVC